MKKLIVFLAILLLAGSLTAENYIHTTFFSDGTKKLWPSGGMTVRMVLDGVQIDLDALAEVGNFRAADSMIICTLQTTSIGNHIIYVSVVDGIDYMDGWDGNYDNRINRIADTVYAILDTMQDGASGQLVDIRAISTDQSAADSLERMLDGNRATLYLSQLNIQADGNKNAIQSYGSGSGAGGAFQGGPTGSGLVGSGGASGGQGMKAVASVDHGFVVQGGAVSGNYDGFRIIKGGTGISMNLQSGRIAGYIDSTSAVGIGATQQNLLAGVVSDSVWQNTRGAFGTYVDGSFGHESFYWDTMGVATVSDADMAAIADTIFGADTASNNGTAGSFGAILSSPSYMTGTASLTAEEIMDSASNRGFVHYDSAAAKLNLRQLVIGGENNDSASLFVYNNGTTPAAQFEGDGELGDPTILIHSDSGYGLKMMTDNKSLDGLESSIYSGFYASAAGIKGFGGVFANTNEDSSATAAGSGLLIKSDGWNNGLTVTVGEAGTDTAGFGGTVPTNKAINVEGPSVFYGRNDFRRMGSASDDALTVHGKNMGKGFYAYSDSSIGARFSTANGDTSIIIGGDVYFGTGQGIHGNLEGTVDDIDSSITASVDFAGAGSYAMTVYAVDTSGTDAAVTGVNIETRNLAGTLQGYLPSNSSGYSVFKVDSGSWIIQASTRNGYIWECDTVLVNAAAKTDTMQGYNINVGSPTATNLCRVYGYVYDISGDSIQGASVKAVLGGRSVRDTCGNVTLATGFAVDTVTTSSGYWCLDLVKSKCLYPSTSSFSLIITYPDGTIILDKKITVPDSTSYRVTW